MQVPPPQPRKTKSPHLGAFRHVVHRVANEASFTRQRVYATMSFVYYVYLLECADDKSWYIGYSANLKQRVERHKKRDGARTTSRKKNWQLIYYEAYLNVQDAKGRGRFLKSGSGRIFLKKQLSHYLAV